MSATGYLDVIKAISDTPTVTCAYREAVFEIVESYRLASHTTNYASGITRLQVFRPKGSTLIEIGRARVPPKFH